MAERHPASSHLVLFDGSCRFCSRATAAIAARDPEGKFRFARLDTEEASGALSALDIERDGSNTMFVITSAGDGPDVALAKSAAVLFILRRLRWPWRASAALGWLPARLLDWAYSQVARSRLLISQSLGPCPLPIEGRPGKR